MKFLKNNKQIGGLQVFIMTVVSVAVILAVGLIVLQNLAEASKEGGVATGANTTATNATKDIISKMSTIPTWIGIIIVVAMAFIVLGYFYMKNQ